MLTTVPNKRGNGARDINESPRMVLFQIARTILIMGIKLSLKLPKFVSQDNIQLPIFFFPEKGIAGKLKNRNCEKWIPVWGDMATDQAFIVSLKLLKKKKKKNRIEPFLVCGNKERVGCST